MPAAFASTSAGPPSRSAASRTAPVTCPGWLTSAVRYGTSGTARGSGRGARRSTATTRAPSASSREIVASPIPEAPPVTRARRPAIRPAAPCGSTEPDTAVDPNRLPGDVGSVTGDQPRDRARDVRAAAVPSHRHTAPDQVDLVLERRARGGGPRAQLVPVHLGGHVARRDRVHPDAVRREFQRERLGEQGDRGLRRTVPGPAGDSLLTKDRAEVHDRAAGPLPDHQAGRGPGAQERRAEVDPNDPA